MTMPAIPDAVCTLVFAWRTFQTAPLVVAANREEATDRPAGPPRLRTGPRQYLAPQDLVANGTWIGYNAADVFVALTNRRTEFEGTRSRGLLVRDALTAESAVAAAESVRKDIEGTRYAGFNIAIIDPSTAVIIEWDGEVRDHSLDPGVHVLANGGRNGDDDLASAVADRITPVDADDPRAWLSRANAVLSDHTLGTCRHENGYGTVSSSHLLADESGRIRYEFAAGAPCETDHRTVFDGHLRRPKSESRSASGKSTSPSE